MMNRNTSSNWPMNAASVARLARLLLLFCAAATPNLRAQSTDAGSQYVTTVATLQLKRETETVVQRSFTGTVVARRASELGFKRIGRLESIQVDHGDIVRQGDLLATLDTASFLAEKRVILARRQAAQAVLDELVAGPRVQTIDAAKAQLTEAEALRDQMRSTFERRKQLANSDAISRQDIDDARHQLLASEANVRAQSEQVAELEAGTRLEKIAAQKADIQGLEAEMQALEILISESQLQAPFSGIIAKRWVDEGAITQPGAPIVRLVEVEPLEAWIGMPVDSIKDLNQQAIYEFRAGSVEQCGKLTAILPELDPTTRTQTAIFELSSSRPGANSQSPMQTPAIGQVIQLDLTQRVPTDGFWVPTQSLVKGSKGLWSVFQVVEATESRGGSILKRCDVEVLRIEADRVLVTGTIQEGDQIVRSGVQKLTNGQAVQGDSRSAVNSASPMPTR